MATSLSRKILLTYAVIFLLMLFGMSAVFNALVLTPGAIYPGLELWRIFTYPLAPGFLDLLIVAICFSVPGEEVENMLGTRLFAMLLAAVVLAGAVLHIIFYAHAPATAMYGPVNASLFIFAGYVYLFPRSEVRLIFFSVPAKVLCLVLLAITAAAAAVQIANGVPVLVALEGGVLGIAAGAAYFHARYQKYPFLLKSIRSMERIAQFNRLSADEGSRPAAQRRSEQRRSPGPQGMRPRIGPQRGAPGEMTDEERLNVILDKISEKSYGALSEEEKRFLREYSGRL